MMKQQDSLNANDKSNSLTQEESSLNPMDVTAQSVVTDRSLNRSNSSTRKHKRKSHMQVDLDEEKIEQETE